MANLTPRERIKNVIEKWYILEPLYFVIITSHNIIINIAIKTVRSGNGKIEYNPNFIDNIDDLTLEDVLKCEMTRIVLKHPYQRKQENAKLSYMASNITLKEYIQTKLNLPSATDVFNNYQYKRKHFEFYYHKLVEKLSEQQQNNSENKEGSPNSNNDDQDKNKENQKQDKNKENDKNKEKNKKKQKEDNDQDNNDDDNKDNDNNNPDDNKEDNSESEEKKRQDNENSGDKSDINDYTDEKEVGRENTETWDKDDLMEEMLNEKIKVIMQQRSWGTVSHDLQEQIQAALKPKIDYKQILRAFRASVISQSRVLTRMKPNRRYDFLYMGSRRDFTTKLLFAVDVSGSMNTSELSKGLAIINHFFKYGIKEIDVIQFDTEIKGQPILFKKAKQQIKINGRGGTDFQCVIDYAVEKRNYDGLIIFTDGYAPIPKIKKRTKTRILWLFISEESYNEMYSKLSHLGKAAFIKNT